LKFKKEKEKHPKHDHQEKFLRKNNKNVTVEGMIIILNKAYLKKPAPEKAKKVTFKEDGKKGNVDMNKINYYKEKPSQYYLLFETIFTEQINIKYLEDYQKLEELNKRDNSGANKRQLTEYVKIKKCLSNYVPKSKEQEKLESTHTEEKTNSTEIVEMEVDTSKEKVVDEKTIPDDKPVTEKTNLTFSNTDIYRKIFENFNVRHEVKKPPTCSVSGEKAKYFDPITKQYYSNIENFKILRERYFQKEEDNLLFRIQTLSDLTSQKKERLKKMLLSNSNSSLSTNTNESANKSILNLVNKYGILKDGEDPEKKVISHRVYSRNRENCFDSGMLIHIDQHKMVISKKIFRDKHSSKVIVTDEEVSKTVE